MTEEKLIEKYIDKNKQEEALKKLEDGKPIQYIIGNVDFYDSIIKVNENVLIPRFETETLLEKLIKLIKKRYNEKIKICDLGTGSGAIAITLAKNLNCEVTAFDISKEALELAKSNADDNKVEISFINFDIRNKIPGTYDVLVSNPPYIDKEDIIDSKVYNNEPHLALFAENKGLLFYEKILSYASEVLNKKSIIAFEIGMTQKEAIISIAKEYFKEASIYGEQDLTGKDRFIFIINE